MNNAISEKRKRELETIMRDLNPTPQARIAMTIWGEEYSQQRGGSMQFWDSLSEDRRRRCSLVAVEVFGKLIGTLEEIKELADEDIRVGAAEKTSIYQIEAKARYALGVAELTETK